MDVDPEPGVDEDYNVSADLVSATPMSEQQRTTLVQQQHNPLDKEAEPLSFLFQSVKDGDRLQPGTVVDLGPGREGTCCSVAQDASTIAVGLRSGEIMLLSPVTQQALATLQLSDVPAAVITSARFRPKVAAAHNGSKPSSLLLVAKGSHLLQVHVGTGAVVSSYQEEHNKINITAVRQDGKLFATAGSDCCVRVYDDAHQTPVVKMSGGDGKSCCGHTNNIFGLVWKPEDPQVMLSGGWDGTVQVWDLRIGHSVRSMAGGSRVCGDALDVQGSKVVTGSFRDKHPVQLWDYGTGHLLTNSPFHQPQPGACLVYAAKFGPAGGSSEGMMVAGGSGTSPLLRLYNKRGHLLGTLPTQSPVYSVDWVSSKQQQADKRKTDLLAVCCQRHVCLMDPTAFITNSL